MLNAETDTKTSARQPDRSTAEKVRAYVERVERLEEEKKALADDIKDIFAEARGNGFDVKALKAVIALRKQDADERREHEAILDQYLLALGMPPLFADRD